MQIEAKFNVNNVALAILLPVKELDIVDGDSNYEIIKCLFQKEINWLPNPIVVCLENSDTCLQYGREMCSLLSSTYNGTLLDRIRVNNGKHFTHFEQNGGISGLLPSPDWTKGFIPKYNALDVMKV